MFIERGNAVKVRAQKEAAGSDQGTVCMSTRTPTEAGKA